MNSNKTTNVLLIIVILLLLLLLFFNQKDKKETKNTSDNLPAVKQVDSISNTKSNVEYVSEPLLQTKEEIITNDNEESVKIDQPEKTKVKTEKKEKVKETPKVKVELVEVPKVNQSAIFKGGKRNNGSQQGTVDGGGNGDGNGTGKGNGTGTGDGGGNGGGSGKGHGFGYDLGGRGIKSSVKPVNNTQEEGTIVIAITVDNLGNVISAEGPVRGTTNSNPYLVKISKEAALKAKFEASDLEAQKGTMTFRYFLNN